MLSEFGIAKWSRWTALLVSAGFAACVDDSVAPAPEAQATPPAKLHVLGFAELTFDGIGTPDLSSSFIMAPTLEALEALRAQRERSGDLRDFVAGDLTFPADSNGAGDGTIQLAQPQRNRFTLDDIRYLNASFNVRNAQSDGTAYDTPRSNLIFLAVGASSTINGTALKLELAGGTPAPPALALQVMPTVRVQLDGDSLIVANPDVLQILREDELTAVAANAPPAVTNVFPYGFVVRRVGDSTTRTLPASPAVGQFHGRVDFAFSIPVQPQPADDPQKLSVLMLAVDDSETRLTQSLQEQNVTSQLSLQQLAGSLSADSVTLLPGGTLPGGTTARTLCSVRTAGMPGSATAHLVNVHPSAFQSFSPDPYATDGNSSHIPNNASFQANFSAAVQGAGPDNFTVRGLQSGSAFIGQSHSGNGMTTIWTPAGDFFPGEGVEIVLTNALACPAPHAARYLVQTGQSTGVFNPDTTYGIDHFGAAGVAIGDLNGDGSLDLATANHGSDNVSVLQNLGDGTFPATNPNYDVGYNPASVAIGDLNGDGSLDLATANSLFFLEGGSTVSVLLNNGDGTFPPTNPTYRVGHAPVSVAIGDLNGDGSLDLVTANNSSRNVTVLLNNGDGTFPTRNPYGTGISPRSVAIGDLNGDGSLDLAVAELSNDITVLLNNGDGTFPATNPTYDTGARLESIAIGDLNGDGSLDLAVAKTFSDSVTVLLNDGNGTFPQNTTYAAGNGPISVAIGDVDGINGLDLVAANDSSANVTVLLNNGNGMFPQETTYGVGTDSYPSSVAIGDLNGDGRLDLAIARRRSVSVSVLLQP